MDLAAPMPLNHTSDCDSRSNQFPQSTTHQSKTDLYPVFFSFQSMDSKRKGLRVNSEFFQKIYLLDGQAIETVATVEELSDLWKPGVRDGVPPVVMNCSCILF